MFINRSEELGFLENKWAQNTAQFIVLWGKRRVGETELVKQFIQGKPYIFFMAESTSDREQLQLISSALASFFNEPLLQARGFNDWEELFVYLGKQKEKFILVIDEFPYLLVARQGIASQLQKAWDGHLKDSSIFLLLLGSSIGMMETEVLGIRSPLYGRRTGQWRVTPLDFIHARNFRSGTSFSDQISHYAVAGGIPAYWLQFSAKLDFWQNIKQNVLAKGQYLYDEAEFMLREELREPRNYFAILTAISQGKRRLSEIVNATGFSPMLVNKYLGILADLHIVERELPATETKPHKSKKGLYRIQDAFLQFWFRFVFPRRSLLELGKIDPVVANIQNSWPTYLGGTYELVCREFLESASQIFFSFDKLGRWWDRHEEIDLVAVNEQENHILFAEVKWTTKPVGLNIYEDLLRKAKLVTWGEADRKEHYALFSKSGYTEAMIRRAQQDRVVLWQGAKILTL